MDTKKEEMLRLRAFATTGPYRNVARDEIHEELIRKGHMVLIVDRGDDNYLAVTQQGYQAVLAYYDVKDADELMEFEAVERSMAEFLKTLSPEAAKVQQAAYDKASPRVYMAHAIVLGIQGAVRARQAKRDKERIEHRNYMQSEILGILTKVHPTATVDVSSVIEHYPDPAVPYTGEPTPVLVKLRITMPILFP